MTNIQHDELANNERWMLVSVEEETDKQEGVIILNVTMLNNKRNGLSDDRLYLDNCSTFMTVKNKTFLKKLRDTDKHLRSSCNTGRSGQSKSARRFG